MMSRTMAEAHLPRRVDVQKVVENNQHFSAQIEPSELPRLDDAVDRCLEPVSCVISFDRDEDRNRVLVGSCSTRVSMICQRCLESVDIQVESQFSLGLVFNDEQARQLPRRLEPVEVDESGILELWSVMEDEVLLALPMFPMHAEGECQARQPEPEEKPGNEKRPNPFDVLAQLKQK